MRSGDEVGAAGVLALVQGGVGGPLQHGQAPGSDRVRRRGADRSGVVDRAAIVQGAGV